MTNRVSSRPSARQRRFAWALMVLAVPASASVWVACSDDDAESTDTDAGADGGQDSSTSGDSGGQDSGGQDAGSDAADLSCASFCQRNLAACVGAVGTDGGNQQFENLAQCMAVCERIPLGSLTDTSGDTVGCRIYHSGLAASQNPTIHCPHAGLMGATVCGTDRCEAFCDRGATICTDAGLTPGQRPFDDKADCLTKCGTDYQFDPASPELTTAGDTLNCRAFELIKAFEDVDGGSAATHCPNLRTNSAVCQ